MPVSPLVQEAKPASIKHDWYQTESHVCVTVLAKNLNLAAVKVEFTPSTVSLFLHIPPFCPFKLILFEFEDDDEGQTARRR